MTGNQDRAARAEARLLEVYDRLDSMLDRAINTLEACELAPEDLLKTQRFTRGLDIVARSARSIARLLIPMVKSPSKMPKAEEIKVRGHDRDDSPENIERLCARIESQLDSVHAVVEEKRLDCEAFARSGSRNGADALAAA